MPVESQERVAEGVLRRATGSTVVRYLAGGASAFVVDLALLGLLHAVLGMEAGAAGALAFLGSFAYTYSMQRFVFRSAAPHGRALVRYSVLVAVNTVATGAILHVLTATPLGWVGAKVVATAATTVWNFFLYRHWVFPHAVEGPRPRAAAEEA